MSSMNEGVDETSFGSTPAASNSKSNALNDSDSRDGKKKPNKSLPANYDFEGGINCHVPFQLDGVSRRFFPSLESFCLSEKLSLDL